MSKFKKRTAIGVVSLMILGLICGNIASAFQHGGNTTYCLPWKNTCREITIIGLDEPITIKVSGIQTAPPID